MLDRFLFFLPSFLCVFCIFIFILLFFKAFKKKIPFNSIRWRVFHPVRAFFLVFVLAGCIGYPAIEELVFRAIIIFLFPNFSIWAWVGIFVSSLVFGVAHYFSKEIYSINATVAFSDSKIKSDDVREILKEIEIRMSPKDKFVRKLTKTCVSFVIGFIYGVVAVKYQSIWVCFVAHSVWNLLAATLIPIVFAIIGMLVNKLKDK